VSETDKSFAREFIGILATCPPDSRMVDAVFVEQCAAFKDGDPVRFLRDLRDELVFSGGCSDAIITAISATLSPYPESDEEMWARREELAKKRG
jgi:hypothetical protein